MQKPFFALAALATFAAVPAAAVPAVGPDPPEPEGSEREKAHALRPGVGIRVGGYAFREADADGVSWDACRMEGAGVFGTLDITPGLFGEISVDFYNAHESVLDHGLDRFSAHTLGAIGYRWFSDFFVNPFVQAGGGAEWTRIEMPELGTEQTGVFPVGFVGFGLGVDVYEGLSAGAQLRMLLTAQAEYDAPDGGVTGTSSEWLGVARERLVLEGSREVETKMRQANEVLFHVSYRL